MKVVSRLVNMDFKIGKMVRKDDQIIITSHESQQMKVKVALSPIDIMDFIRAALNWSVILYVIKFPISLIRYKREIRGKDNNQ